MTAVRFSKPEVVILSRRNRYARLPPSKTDSVTKPELGSRFPTLWPPYCKIDAIITQPPIARFTTKFGRQMQNDMLTIIHRSKSRPEIEFQYGGRPFSKTGSSFISAVD